MTRPQRIAFAIAVLFGAALMAGAAFVAVLAYVFRDDGFIKTFDSAEFATLDEWPGATGFEDQFELDFPPSSRDIRLASDGFQDPIYQFRMTVDPADLALLATSQGCNGLLSQPASQQPQSVITNLEWWAPESAEVYQACAGGDTPGRSQHVFVDQSDPDAFDVYVIVFYF